MSVARLARDVLPQPWLFHHLLEHVKPRVLAEADREMQPLARSIIERRRLKQGEKPRCVMSMSLRPPTVGLDVVGRNVVQFDVPVVPEHSVHGCLTLRAGLVLPTCSWHYGAWLRSAGVEWAARALGLVPFAGDLNRPDGVALYWPKAPHRSPRLFSGAAGERLQLTAEQAHVLADAIADIGRPDCADMVRHLADWSSIWSSMPGRATTVVR